ncbi:MAG: pectate lyase [Chitinispirillales bacterium]|nr:pectate lyase [Chitinispirillales bacterium]
MKSSNIITSMALLACISLSLPAKISAQEDYDWSALLRNNDAWFNGTEARTIADDIVRFQLPDGGWRKDMANEGQTGEWGKSTIDNDATISQIIFLARIYGQTNNSTYRTSCQRGIDLLLDGQYPNGGWPQIFGARADMYHRHITFNDNAMVQVLQLLKSISERSGHFTFIDANRAARATTAVERGVECIINAQIVFDNGVVTAWCQQHDMVTLAPMWGRAYEPPAITGSESVGIVNFLISYNNSLSTPRLDVVRSINAAVTWMTNSRIVGFRVENITTGGSPDRRLIASPGDTIWARFYEINTNRPVFVGRDGIVRYNMSEIEQERRAGYAWYGNWPRNLVRAGLLPEPDVSGIYIGSGELIDSLMLFDPSMTNAANWSVQDNFRESAQAYGDRAFQTVTVSPELQGAEWISPAAETRTRTSPDTIIQFRMKKDGMVYVAHEDRVSPRPAWIAARGFTETNYAVSVNDNNANRTFTVYGRAFQQGEIVAMGRNSNDGTTTSLMYLVAVAEQGSTASVINRTAKPVNYALNIVRVGGGAFRASYSIASSETVRLDLFDIRGGKIKTLVNSSKTAGAHQEHFSASGLAAGIYLVRLHAGTQVLRQRFVVVK